MILISKTFAIYTEESINDCEASESGFEFEDTPHTFKGLIALIKHEGLTLPSSYPASGDTFEWLTNHGETNYRTGEERIISIFYSRKNNPRSAKYWRKAFAACGITK